MKKGLINRSGRRALQKSHYIKTATTLSCYSKRNGKVGMTAQVISRYKLKGFFSNFFLLR